MWKWTDSQNIKIVILDCDSLNKDILDFDFSKEFNPLSTIKVKKQNKQATKDKDTLYYFDTIWLLSYILKTNNNVNSTNIIAISADFNFLKEMMQFHIGTISTETQRVEYLKSAPDFQNCNLDNILSILKGEEKGFAAEVISTYGRSIRKMSLIKSKKEIIVNNRHQIFNIYFGGRYFSSKKLYITNDPLSCFVRQFKKSYIIEIDEFYDSALSYISRQNAPDIITYVPLKPSQIKSNSFNRFASLHLNKLKKDGIILQNILICLKDYVQKDYDANSRAENIKGVFKIKDNIDVKDKNIIVIDDVYATGSTISEIVRCLYEAGAKNVEVLVLAINQLTDSYLISKNIKCPICNKDLILKVNSQNGSLFFGCTNYQSHIKQNNDINIQEGIKHLKLLNKLSLSDIHDLDDIY